MASTFVRPKLNISKTGSSLPPKRPSRLPTEKTKFSSTLIKNKFELDHTILDLDSQSTYLEFLEKNPLRLSMQKLNGRMDHRWQKKLDLDRIEETYWSQWRPNKNGVFIETIKNEKKKTTPRSKKGEGDTNYNDKTEIKNITTPLEYKPSKPLSKIDELTEDDGDIETSSSVVSNVEEPKDFKFLRHTDSFILNSKKQTEEKPHYQQPRCIRLYKKNSSGSYIKGGSYPLKPCLKKESTFKGYTRRPLTGTPYSAGSVKTGKYKIKGGTR